jgi:hypothetical protein
VLELRSVRLAIPCATGAPLDMDVASSLEAVIAIVAKRSRDAGACEHSYVAVGIA